MAAVKHIAEFFLFKLLVYSTVQYIIFRVFRVKESAFDFIYIILPHCDLTVTYTFSQKHHRVRSGQTCKVTVT